MSLALREKATHTLKDEDRRLFRTMIALIEEGKNDPESKKWAYGVNSFDHVWEGMIDRVYGISNKSDYYPKAYWAERPDGDPKEASDLRPDTIMKLKRGGDLYVLDAKYYLYGVTKKTGDLPQTADINKQISYGEYVSQKHPQSKVYNAFVIPFDKDSNPFDGLINGWLGNVAEATPNWKAGNRLETYEKIQGIVMDTKSLMQADWGYHSQSKEELANAINALFFSSDCVEEANLPTN